jgi:hypothetical protein
MGHQHPGGAFPPDIAKTRLKSRVPEYGLPLKGKLNY